MAEASPTPKRQWAELLGTLGIIASLIFVGLELRQNTLVYLLAHSSREAGEASWRAFGADPEWQRVSEESQRDGRIISSVERMWLDPTDFSQMK